MTADAVLRDALDPGLDLLASIDGPRRDARADALLLAIAGQESAWVHRAQRQGGPARGLWQFERGGGVAGVLQHRASARLARALCVERDVTPDPLPVWERLAVDDILAAGFARLLLWTDPRPLPEIGDQSGAWRAYLKSWRPGKPHADRWPRNYRGALAALARAREESS